MSFRINPYKIVRLIAIIAVLSYGYVEIAEFRKKKIEETKKVEKTLDIRKKDFYNSQEEKQKILNQGTEVDVVSNSEETQPPVTVKISEANKDNQKVEQTQEQKEAAKKKAEAAKKAQEQRKAEEEAQRKIVDQIAQQRKALAEKKAREAEIKEAEKKAKEKTEEQAKQAKKKNNETKKISKKYIQVATLNSEAAAKSAVSKLGGSFNYQKISGKGKTLYVIVSVSTDNPATLSSLENQVKTKLPSSKYIVRSAGK